MLSERLMHNVTLSSFLKPFSKDSKDSKESKYTKLGHHIEKALIDNLFKDAQNNIDTGSTIDSVCENGGVIMKI